MGNTVQRALGTQRLSGHETMEQSHLQVREGKKGSCSLVSKSVEAENSSHCIEGTWTSKPGSFSLEGSRMKTTVRVSFGSYETRPHVSRQAP